MSTAFAHRYLRHPDGLAPNLAALGFALAGYAGGLLLITRDNGWANLIGVALLAEAMVVAAYLIHECAHNTIFKSNAANARLGRALNWLTGGCYGTYDDLRHKHLRHHVDRADVVSFDYREFLRARPRLLRLIQALEWAYIPATDLMMHAFVLVRPFVYPRLRHLRARVAGVVLVRGALFAALGWTAPKALLLYALAYGLFVTVLRFMDAHQHTFELFATLDGADPRQQRFDRDYEHRNTFSNPLSTLHPWLNLLVLNFGYHNAHHARPSEPWYRLPALHRRLYGSDGTPQLLAAGNLFRSYHRYRVRRVLNADPSDLDIGSGPRRGADFVGVYGVSFLTAL